MSGFLKRLAARGLGLKPGLQPRRASLFEGAAPLAEPEAGAPSLLAPAPARAAEAPAHADAPAAPLRLPSLELTAPAPRPAPTGELRPAPESIHAPAAFRADAPLLAAPREERGPAPHPLPLPRVEKETRLEARTESREVHERETRVERLTRELQQPLLLPSAAGPRPLPLARPAAAPQAPSVQVSIGRVEIRASAQPERRPRPAAPAQASGLEDYLRSRRRP